MASDYSCETPTDSTEYAVASELCAYDACTYNSQCASRECLPLGVCAEIDFVKVSNVVSNPGDYCNSLPTGTTRCDGVLCSSDFDCKSLTCDNGKCESIAAYIDGWNDTVDDAVEAWLIAVIVVGVLIVLGIIGCIVCCCCAAGMFASKVSKKSKKKKGSSSSSSSDSDKAGTKEERKARKKAKKQQKQMEKEMKKMQEQAVPN